MSSVRRISLFRCNHDAFVATESAACDAARAAQGPSGVNVVYRYDVVVPADPDELLLGLLNGTIDPAGEVKRVEVAAYRRGRELVGWVAPAGAAPNAGEAANG